jgi:hypothetical protein
VGAIATVVGMMAAGIGSIDNELAVGEAALFLGGPPAAFVIGVCLWTSGWRRHAHRRMTGTP